MAVTFTIPIPPSVNHLFRHNVKGRFKTRDYKSWLQAAALTIMSQRVPATAGEVVIEIYVQRETACSDIDNRIKAALDLIVSQRLIEDDRHVRKVSAEWAKVTGCRVTISPFTEEMA